MKQRPSMIISAKSHMFCKSCTTLVKVAGSCHYHIKVAVSYDNLHKSRCFKGQCS
ncbi:hypothetical protein HanIR_Chr11g0558561 [Helianthus annuus]|nr:hypothetical protein HanIR_Chr11g0558561 [Helianthus annuus]